MRMTKKIGLAGLAGALALAIAGCGGTAVSHAPKPAPKSSATAPRPVSSGLTLVEATSIHFIQKFPLVNCGTLSPAAQAAWAPLLAGSRIGECAPANYVSQDVPTVRINVVNNDPSMTQAQANAYGRALLATLGWISWTGAADTPALMTDMLGGSQTATYVQMLDKGGVLVSPTPGIAAWPDRLVIEPLSRADMPIMANPAENWAIVAEFAPYTVKYQYSVPPGVTPPFPLTGTSPNTPSIYTGTLATSPVLGTYLAVDTYGLYCNTGPAAGICGLAGAGG